MNLIQYLDANGARCVGRVEGDKVTSLKGVESVLDVARKAIAAGQSLEKAVTGLASSGQETYDNIVAQGRLLSPVDHPDPAHCIVTGTGLTHLSSAATRDSMHKQTKEEEAKETDSIKMFKLGLKGGKPQGGGAGVQPEWFYKGDGSTVSRPGGDLTLPSFALDGGEEPEIAGLYLIGDDGKPYRLGFALGNEYSDHVMERQNYLYLAHSKLRTSAIGPELHLGALPQDLQGESRILRGGKVIWRKPFVTGEANMSHTIANLEYHHFKYAAFRRSGDLHIHFFGTSTLSFADGIKPAEGDVFEIEMKEFGHPLRNRLMPAPVNFEYGGVQIL
jgi:hypothetical protein